MSEKRIVALKWAFGINLAFLLVELIGGILSNSMALLADAGHMFSDVASLGFALVIIHILAKPASSKRSYGYGRAEVLAGFVNALLLCFIVGVLVIESFDRITNPVEIDSTMMLWVSVAGLLANLASAAVLAVHHKDDLNIRGAFLHLVADALGSVGAIIAGLLIMWKGWALADPIASLIIAALILYSSWGLIKEALHILLEGTPPGVNLNEIRKGLENIEGVCGCHDLHAWLIGSREPMLTAHITVSSETDPYSILTKAERFSREEHDIIHCTFQVECQECTHLHK
ncbi:cation diffusion facilitator family transporter [bacterium]|nr:cation diffusion facilitator family transporter [bacterium]